MRSLRWFELPKPSSRWSGASREIVLVLLVAMSCLAIARWGREGRGKHPEFLALMLTPVQHVGVTVGKAWGVVGAYTSTFTGLHRQVSQLEAENQQLREELYAHHGLVERMQREVQLASLGEQVPYKLTAASVIGRQKGDFNCLILDKGSIDGLTVDMPVLGAQGLVGRLDQVLPRSARVMLLDDQNSVAGVVISVNGDSGSLEGILRGRGGDLPLALDLPRGQEVPVGAKVFTSALSTFYPAGLHVGMVADQPAVASELFRQYTITPVQDFDDLRQVMIITDLYRQDARQLLAMPR